jgi:hypothetical protein
MVCKKPKILRNRLTHRIVYDCVLGYIHIFFFVALRPIESHGPLILEVSRSHTTTHHSR